MRALTKRQREYAKRRANGESRAKAYKNAGYSDKQSDKTADRNAIAMEHANSRILAEIQRLQDLADQGAIMDRRQRQALLTELAQDREGARADRIRALDLLAKMSGDYTERVIYEGTSHVSIEQARQEAWDSLKEP